MQSSVPTTAFMSVDYRNPDGETTGFTRALPAWPISRRSAPFTGAKSSLGRRGAGRFAFFGAAFFAAAFFGALRAAAFLAVFRGAALRAAGFFAALVFARFLAMNVLAGR